MWLDADKRRWRERYEAGETYEEIALDVGASIVTVRKGVLAVGGTSRRVGQRKDITRNTPTAEPDEGSSIRKVKWPGDWRGHRRRGRRVR